VSLADVLGDDFVGFEWLPGEVLQAGATVDVPLWFSQWSGSEARELSVSVRWNDGPWSTSSFTSAPWEVIPIDGLSMIAPAETGEHSLVVQVEGDSGRICANRLIVVVE